MTAPNIVNVTNIVGHTDVLAVTTATANVVVNASGSNSVYKINVALATNVNTSVADVTLDLYRSSTAYRIAKGINVPVNSTLVVIGKDMSLYLQEGDALRATASANSSIELVCSYEVIS